MLISQVIFARLRDVLNLLLNYSLSILLLLSYKVVESMALFIISIIIGIIITKLVECVPVVVGWACLVKKEISLSQAVINWYRVSVWVERIDACNVLQRIGQKKKFRVL
jgi:hypothetical protein